LFRSILDQAKPLGLSGVKLTGGEPLLHPNIGEILAAVQDAGLSLAIETNGVLCSPSLAARIAACPGVFVSVSLDSPEPATHEWIRGVDGCFEAAISGIRNLVAAGLRPQLIMTIMEYNKNDLRSMVHLAESHGAGSVKFNLLQPTARGEKLHKTGQALSLNDLVEMGRWVENTLSRETSLPLIFHHPAAFRPLGRLFGNGADGCGVCGILGILGVLADGSYALCGIGETMPELESSAPRARRGGRDDL
jgi:SynChlorMet cassette radical SAM/SPASM protein ScmF